ncbi:Cell wall assembly/cell proliferation coordinating protein, KNR4 [Cystobacter fuscus]|uniref:Cell wall assembly/cell proliferation coordinating protein, KNR4 n=1 Tax=Cystobacter fuscus TaxID=43 RepID=A0A250JF50_9BACT|nr:SMI1/KNR4 family protein [Cystobacter fuscus]ATB41776.1 Cell wall assembly/cell proliferation coordinating protein, KNR4 [Cystobacter fuscus]
MWGAPLEQAWLRYREWLQGNAPELANQLRPPANEASIQGLEEVVGGPLPIEVTQWWRLNDGQGDGEMGVLAGFQFLSVAEAQAEWRQWAGLRAHSSARELQDLNKSALSLAPGAIQRVYTHPGWVPLWKEPLEGNYLGVDLAPGPQGHVGQVINFGRDEDDKAVLARSLAELIEWLDRQAEQGCVRPHSVRTRSGKQLLELRHVRGRVLTVLLQEAREKLRRGGD